jgi:hypothetical protein
MMVSAYPQKTSIVKYVIELNSDCIDVRQPEIIPRNRRRSPPPPLSLQVEVESLSFDPPPLKESAAAAADYFTTFAVSFS